MLLLLLLMLLLLMQLLMLMLAPVLLPLLWHGSCPAGTSRLTLGPRKQLACTHHQRHG